MELQSYVSLGLALTVGIALPVAAVSYLRPILVTVMKGLCNAEGGAEFWVRSAYVLTICGTLLLVLVGSSMQSGNDFALMLRVILGWTFLGVFLTVAIIARNIWTQVRQTQIASRTHPATVAAEPRPTILSGPPVAS